MISFSKKLWVLLFAGLALAVTASFASAGPPNWKVNGVGHAVQSDGIDIDSFSGQSTHLGRYTAEGYHVLFEDFSFVGGATYTAANGATLDIVYMGQLFLSDDDPDYPFGFIATVEVVGGTGRLAGATGSGIMTGSFTFDGRNYFFEINGTLKSNGK